jgi:hypothetical protein
MPGDVLRSGAFGRHHVGVGPEQVLEEVLVAFRGGTEEIGAPQRQRAGPVLRRIGVLDCHLDRARCQRIGDIRTRIRSFTRLDRCHCLVGEIQGIDIELGIERHPTHPRGLCDGIRSVHPCQVSLGQR